MTWQLAIRAAAQPRLLRASLCLLILTAMLSGAACTSLAKEGLSGRTVSNVLPATDTPLGRLNQALMAAHGSKSGFKMVSVGVQGLVARIDMIDAAQRTLDVQSYIFRNDKSGREVVKALIRAADRGVRVRVLVDDGETISGDEKILSLSAHAGLEVRIFNPLVYRGHNRIRRAAEFLFDKARVDYRMHDKLMVADNAVGIIGGRNIGDQYFQIDPQSQFGDDDVIVAGPVVPQLSQVFDRFWNDPIAVPAPAIDRGHTNGQALDRYIAELAQSSPAQHTGEDDSLTDERPFQDLLSGKIMLHWAAAKVIYDSPDKKEVEKGKLPGSLIYGAITEQMKETATELLTVTAYFIPSKDELSELKAARERHVRVGVLTNSLKAAPSSEAHSGYMHYRVRLLQEGVELYEVRALLGSARGSGQGQKISRHGNYALHAKLLIFDRRRLFVGSMNVDQRSKHLNTEIGLLIDSPELSAEVITRFDALTGPNNSYRLSLQGNGTHPRLRWTTREGGTTVNYDTEPADNVWQRLKVRLLTWLPLDREL